MTRTAPGVGEVLQHVIAQVIANPGFVPDRGRQQPLHPSRAGIPDMLGDRPAVHPRQPGQQAPNEGCRRSTRANRPPTRSISSSNSRRQRSRFTLRPAATA